MKRKLVAFLLVAIMATTPFWVHFVMSTREGQLALVGAFIAIIFLMACYAFGGLVAVLEDWDLFK